MEFAHTSVLLNECIENLNVKDNGCYVDGTLGGGGHSGEILKKLGKGGILVAIDRDEEAIAAGKKHLESIESEGTFYVCHENFGNMDKVCEGLGIENVDGILLDLGVSSHQFDDAERGFSYRFDAPLDMRMNREDKLTAKDVVNNYSERALSDIIFNYGEEKWAKRIAEFIVNERKIKPIETTGELVTVIKKAIPKGAREDGGHPAKRTFQAIRIEVNGELDVLGDVIQRAIDLLKPGARLCIITFHSLEEGIVKKLFKKAENPCTCPPDFPVCTCGKKPLGRMVRKAILPTKEEIERNSRSKSAKLRVFEKY